VQIGAQSYSFRDRPMDKAIQAYKEAGLANANCGKATWSRRIWRARRGSRGNSQVASHYPLDHFTQIRNSGDEPGILLYAYNLSFNDSFTDEEIDRGFQMVKAMGVKYITASSTLTAAKKVAPFADKHKSWWLCTPRQHQGTRSIRQAESFDAAMRCRSISGSTSTLATSCPPATTRSITCAASRSHRHAAHQGSQQGAR